VSYHLYIENGIRLSSGSLCGTEDQREGTRAFLEKRTPTWTGR
jgi:enoyl-CoA hydratase/carnithine racemase